MVEMEGKPSPHLKKVLKSYQLNAANTMNGPGMVLSRADHHHNGSGSNGTSSFSQFSHRNTSKFGIMEPAIKKDTFKRTFFMKQQEASAGERQLLLNKNPVLSSTYNKTSLGNQNETCSQKRLNINGLDIVSLKKDNRTHLVDGIYITPVIDKKSSYLPPPILSTADRCRSEKRETTLEGELISYFAIGGEKRLCFPQILTTVLRGFTLQQINQVCDELQIFCSQCSPDQLEVLKVTGIIPMSAPSCGLIKKTDAERLVNCLLHRNPPKAAVSFLAASSLSGNKNQPVSHFHVYHECFGKCKGVILPHLYEKQDALCIECVECHGLFSPQRFVSHSHRTENRISHWGFESSLWRRYLMVFKDERMDEDTKQVLEATFNDLKARFELKRKETAVSEEVPEEHVIIKKICYSPPETPTSSKISLSPTESFSNLPTKKRLPLIQCSNNMDSDDVAARNEVETIKKLILQRLDPEGADIVNGLIDKLNKKISSLEQICKNQDMALQEITESKSSGSSGHELQAKVNTMEAELHSLKKQFLRRHEHDSEHEEAVLSN